MDINKELAEGIAKEAAKDIRERDELLDVAVSMTKLTMENARDAAAAMERVVAAKDKFAKILIGIIALQFIVMAGAATWFFANLEIVDYHYQRQEFEWHEGDFEGNDVNIINQIPQEQGGE